MKAELLLSQVQTPGAQCHAAGSHPPAAAEAAEAEAPRGTQKKGGKPSVSPKIR